MPVFKISGADRTQHKLVFASSLQELLQKGSLKLKLHQTATGVFTDDEGLEIDEDEILLNMDSNVKLMLCCVGEEWHPMASACPPTTVKQVDRDSSAEVSVEIEPEPTPVPASPEKENTVNISDTASPASKMSAVRMLYWKRPYRIPLNELPGDLRHSLESEQVLGEPQRKKLLSALYEDITKYTFYPTPRQYTDILQALFDKWPYLSHVEGLVANDSMTLWRKRLRFKFINSRRRRDQGVSAVQERKLKRKREQYEDLVASHEPMYGVANYLPDRMPGEDDDTIRTHIAWMKNHHQTRPKKPDYARVDLLMSRTLSDRRHLLVNQGVSVESLVAEYPWLADEDEMLAEYSRLTGNDMMRHLQTFGMEYGHSVLEMVQPLKKKPAVLELMRQSMQSKKTEDERKAAMPALGFAGVFALLKEDISLFMNRTQTENSPVQVITENPLEGPYTIQVENVKLCDATTLDMAVGVYLSTFYVFNLAYPAKLTRTLLLCEKLILKLGEDSAAGKPRKIKDAHKTVISLVAKLNSKRALNQTQ